MRHKVDDAYAKEPNRGWKLNEGRDGTMPKWSANNPGPAAAKSDKDPIVTKQGFWLSCLHNTLFWLEKNGRYSAIRYDRFRQVVLAGKRPLDDELVISLTAEIERDIRSAWCQDHVRSALVETAHRHDFSSLTEWLGSLKWDGTSRLGRFFPEAYGCELSDYTKACADVLFISGVARAYQPGCQADGMVVLIGAQGVGKSMGMAALCPDLAWYADDLGCDLGDRKAGEGLRGKWLIEFSEFSRINRATLDVVKSFITRRSDYYRPAYGRTHKDYPRTCIFVGTTNDPHPLQDRENRRFMPVECPSQAKVEWISANRDQLWAEAVALYRDGAKWWVICPTLLAEIAGKQEDARQNDAWEEILAEEIGHLSSITMQRAAEALKIEIGRLDRSTQTRIGLVLKSLGYNRNRVMVKGKRAYIWTT
jgi:predicted P-loop ATPase